MNRTAMMAALAMASAGPIPLGYRLLSGGTPRLGNPRKQTGGRNFLVGERERQRREWRGRVDEAAKHLGDTADAFDRAVRPHRFDPRGYELGTLSEALDWAVSAHAEALYAPKPWRRA